MKSPTTRAGSMLEILVVRAVRAVRVVCIVLASGTAACGGDTGSARPEWRFALEEIEGSVQHAYATRFKERIEAVTDGAVEVGIYPYGALGTSAQLTELVQNGALQLAFASPGHLGNVVPEAQVFLLHFLLPDDDASLRRVLVEQASARSDLSEAYRERGLELLAVVPEGWMVWTGDRPLRTLADFAGFKMRTMTSPLLLEVYRTYGASPAPTPYSEVYSGLQLNMIDGQENPVFAIEEMSFHEVQDYMTFASHLQYVSTLVANPAFYRALDPALRDKVDAVRRELDAWVYDYQHKLNAERLDTIRAEGGTQIVELNASEREIFRRASLPIRERFLEVAGERGERILKSLAAQQGDGSS